MPITPVTQQEYVTYTRYFDEVRTIRKGQINERLDRLMFVNGKLIKDEPGFDGVTLYGWLKAFEYFEALKTRIDFINAVHQKLAQGSLQDRKIDDQAPLAAEYYNKHKKIIDSWNKIFAQHYLSIEKPPENLEPSFHDTTLEQQTYEKGLDQLLELYEKYPKLKRTGDLNDHTKGCIEIIYNRDKINEAREITYNRLFEREISKGKSDKEAHEYAVNSCNPGVVFSDQYWLWIRDAVQFPSGFIGTYNRMVWRCDLDKVGGAAALPVIQEGDIKKIVAHVAFRHSIGKFVLEMARGAAKADENNPAEVAAREVREETGIQISAANMKLLGWSTPDSGLTITVVPIYTGEVESEGETKQDKTEAIADNLKLTFEEILEGYKQGFIMMTIKGIERKVYVSDPFLAFALLMAQHTLN